jgi:hypothetical protein
LWKLTHTKAPVTQIIQECGLITSYNKWLTMFFKTSLIILSLFCIHN